MRNNRFWECLFSRSGSEIVEIAHKLGRWPDRIITNKIDLTNIHPELKSRHIVRMSNNPSTREYQENLSPSALITLNGYLRILPPDVCNTREIYNGHPGLITKYPELKGKDPQARAVTLGLETSGSVIHRVISLVDAGEILADKEVSIKGMLVSEVLTVLHNTSVDLWVDFLREKL